MKIEDIIQNEAHLWYGDPTSVSNPYLLRRCGELLTEDEREKISRYHLAVDQHNSLVTRAMLRCVLSCYKPVSPSDWQFRLNQHGRPEIAMPSSADALRFNVAHTKGMIAILVSKDREVGVDVECVPYSGPYLEIASRFFAPTEVSALRSLPTSKQARRFVQMWTLKESYSKARGLGLAMSLNEFSFHIEEPPEQKIEINFSHSGDVNPMNWQFSLNSVGRRHMVATAIERLNREKIQITHRKLFPASAAMGQLFKLLELRFN